MVRRPIAPLSPLLAARRSSVEWVVVSTLSRPVVLIAEKLAPSVLDVFGDEFDVQHVDGTDRPALFEALVDAEALLVRSSTRVDAEALERAPRLKVVARAGVGLDNIDVPAATERGVMVVNAPISNIVSAVFGRCREITSARDSNSSRSTSSMPSCVARAGET